MDIIKKIKNVFKRIQYEITYLRMEYHLIKTMSDSEPSEYYLSVSEKRNIGKSCALARLSVKFDIPIIIKNYTSLDLYTKLIPNSIPKYFKHERPVIVLANEYELRGRRFDIVLVEEGVINPYDNTMIIDKKRDLISLVSDKIVGYR